MATVALAVVHGGHDDDHEDEGAEEQRGLEG
jgi:hypothetical protein